MNKAAENRRFDERGKPLFLKRGELWTAQPDGPPITYARVSRQFIAWWESRHGPAAK